MANLDNAEKRKSASGISLIIPGVTINSAKDAQWRAQAGWSYSGLIADAPGPGGGSGGNTGITGITGITVIT